MFNSKVDIEFNSMKNSSLKLNSERISSRWFTLLHLKTWLPKLPALAKALSQFGQVKILGLVDRVSFVLNWVVNDLTLFTHEGTCLSNHALEIQGFEQFGQKNLVLPLTMVKSGFRSRLREKKAKDNLLIVEFSKVDDL